MQQLVFECAQRLTREYCAQPAATIAPHTLFPQLIPVVDRYLARMRRGAPWWGHERRLSFTLLRLADRGAARTFRPDQAQGEAPRFLATRRTESEDSTADVDTWTSKDVREVTRSHVNFVIADTQQWEQAAAFILDTHPRVEAFVKNAGLRFRDSIPQQRTNA